MEKQIKKTSKIIKRIIIILVVVACFLAPIIWCVSCMAQYVLPKITGSPDDGIWFYSGNYRALSDMSSEEKLISFIKADNQIYTVEYIKDYEYHGDDVYMCVIFVYADSSYGSAFVKYNIETKLTEFVIVGSDSFEPDSIGIVKDDYCLVFNKYRDRGYIIGNDGAMLDEDFPYMRTDDFGYYFTDEYIFRYYFYGGIVNYKKWDDSDFVKIIDIEVDIIQYLYYNDGILFVSIIRSWEYNWAMGKMLYNMATGDMICLADPNKNQTISFKCVESDEKILAAYYSDKITAAYYIVSEYTETTYENNGEIHHGMSINNSRLMHVELATFKTRNIYTFPDTSQVYSFQTGNEYFDSRRVNISGTVTSYNFDVEKEKIENNSYEESVWEYRRTIYQDEKYEFFVTARKTTTIFLNSGYKLILNRYNKNTNKTDVMHHAGNSTKVGYRPDVIRYY